MRFRELAVVRLSAVVTGCAVSPGAIGTVVHIFDSPDEAYEVEFANELGQTVAMCTLRPDQIELVSDWPTS